MNVIYDKNMDDYSKAAGGKKSEKDENRRHFNRESANSDDVDQAKSAFKKSAFGFYRLQILELLVPVFIKDTNTQEVLFKHMINFSAQHEWKSVAHEIFLYLNDDFSKDQQHLNWHCVRVHHAMNCCKSVPQEFT